MPGACTVVASFGGLRERFAAAWPRPASLEGLDADDEAAADHEQDAPIAQGMSNAQIADTLVLSRATAKTHVANILEKLDARDRVQAAALAYQSGLMR
jgi:Bacterial regulatory proteins, luxR family